MIDAIIERQQQAVYFGDQAKKAYENEGVRGVLDMRYTPETDTQDQTSQAEEWARANPNDPRSSAILQKLGIQ